MKKHLSTILLVITLMCGTGIMLYPSIADWWNSFHQSQAISRYAENVANISPEEYERLWSAANAYNQALTKKQNPFVVDPSEWDEYYSLLNIAGDGIIGYVEISKIGCHLPIYHGTGDDVLQVAIGHLQGSSLPIGGPSTHCVLSGHRGLPSARLFTDLPKLVEGDTFTLRILNETLTYQIDQLRTVLPTDLDELAIAEGRDFCTLVTCTPYGVNTHRMLVRGKRIENDKASESIFVTPDAVMVDPTLVAIVAAIPMFVVAFTLLLIKPSKGKPTRVTVDDIYDVKKQSLKGEHDSTR